MTTKHDYMAALAGLKTVTEHVNGETNITTAGLSLVWLETHMGAAINALKVAHAVMQEPSDEAVIATSPHEIDDMKKAFKAMRDKMLEGVE